MDYHYLKKAQELIKDGNVEFVRIEVADLNGCSRGFLLNAHFFIANCETGFGITQSILAMPSDGQVLFDIGMTKDISYRDMGLYPDITTFQILPWLEKTASVLADAREKMEDEESDLHPCVPRNICQNQVDKLWETHGLRLYSTYEYEFYLVDEKTGARANNEVNTLSTQIMSHHEHIATDIMRNMIKIGISPERFHTEYAKGQFEVSQSPTLGVSCPDNAFRTKQLVKEIARKHGYKAIWMSKPFPNESGSSAHFNHSLRNGDGDNVFYDPDMQYGLSKIARSWLAGLVHHSDALLALASTTPNCFERSNTGGFAPINNAWGLDNRSVAFRTKKHGSKKVYFEVRLPGAATNPYLFEAGCIIAGMDGVRNEMVLKGDPYEGDITAEKVLPDHISALPKSLSAALDCLLGKRVFMDEIGEEFLNIYSGLKKHEDKMAEEHREQGDLFEWYMDFFGERV